MSNAMFSIKPIYAEAIISGRKKYEFRTKCCTHHINKLYVYATSPICKVIGEVVVSEILWAPPQIIWEQTHDTAGIDIDSFFTYFNDRPMACAYVLEHPVRYVIPLDLKSFGINHVPQSFVYIKTQPNIIK